MNAIPLRMGALMFRGRPASSLTLLGAVVLLLMAGRVQGQLYSVDWMKVSGGGGSSTGALYSLSGTIGQHDGGGPLAGGNFSLTGGFWAPFAALPPNTPALRIFLTATNTVVAAWAAPSIGFVLQQNANLANSAGWSNSNGQIYVVGSENQFIISPAAGNLFFRLKK